MTNFRHKMCFKKAPFSLPGSDQTGNRNCAKQSKNGNGKKPQKFPVGKATETTQTARP
jgi:hypothetical protein